ncbi:hypothetical protein FS837_012522, partial [Tulasnella sp. UAMH 9824]
MAADAIIGVGNVYCVQNEYVKAESAYANAELYWAHAPGDPGLSRQGLTGVFG